jgi:hypothetical protein
LRLLAAAKEQPLRFWQVVPLEERAMTGVAERQRARPEQLALRRTVLAHAHAARQLAAVAADGAGAGGWGEQEDQRRRCDCVLLARLLLADGWLGNCAVFVVLVGGQRWRLHSFGRWSENLAASVVNEAENAAI